MRERQMVEPLITVVTVNYNTSDFIELMLYALRKLTFNSYKVIICDNGYKDKDILRLVKIAKENKGVELIFRQQNGPASKAHSEALDVLIGMVNTKYTVTFDSDCTFLLKNWDKRLIEKIDDKVKVIGTTCPEGRCGQRIGAGAFPLPFAALFETDVYKKLGISCVAGNVKKGEDTCWQWKTKFAAGGYEGQIFITRNTRDFKKGPFRELTGIEEYYLDEDILIASHFGRGSSNGAAKYFKWFKIPIISAYIRRYCGRIEKKRWISTCYQIINEQS